MKTRDCDNCKYFDDRLLTFDYKGGCKKGHKPRFYKPTEMQTLRGDMNWGYKRKCSDYKEVKND